MLSRLRKQLLENEALVFDGILDEGIRIREFRLSATLKSDQGLILMSKR